MANEDRIVWSWTAMRDVWDLGALCYVWARCAVLSIVQAYSTAKRCPKVANPASEGCGRSVPKMAGTTKGKGEDGMIGVATKGIARQFDVTCNHCGKGFRAGSANGKQFCDTPGCQEAKRERKRRINRDTHRRKRNHDPWGDGTIVPRNSVPRIKTQKHWSAHALQRLHPEQFAKVLTLILHRRCVYSGWTRRRAVCLSD